ncbi:ATP-binding protein [Flavihumibacter sediminis]|nr:ATP-binding protein [Flavihumibacter sediminis]
MPSSSSSTILESAQLISVYAEKKSLPTLVTTLEQDPLLLSFNQFFSIKDPAEGILLSWFLANSLQETEIKLPAILSHFGNDLAHTHFYLQALRSLCERQLLRGNISPEQNTADFRTVYSLPPSVLNAAIRENNSLLTRVPAPSYAEFLNRIFQFIEWRSDKSISFSSLEMNVIAEEDLHTNLAECQAWNDLHLPLEERLFLYTTIRHILISDDTWIGIIDMLKIIFDLPTDQYRFLENFRNGSLQLQQASLVEYYHQDLSTESYFRISSKAIRLLMPGTRNEMIIGSDLCVVTFPEKIREERLYFNDTDRAQIELLSNALQPQQLMQLQEALTNAGMSPAITILLHGHPGTGKTASVMQWARETGRAVMRVEIPKIRDKWVGSSERNLQRVFDEYNNACKRTDRLPILLFNEADAIFGQRIAVERSVDQLHNNLQNILLQALEDFKGILAATTNLPKMLDPAFDRRFLYKIGFTKPDKATRLQVMHDTFPEMEASWLHELDDRYELTAAQIRNLGKKMLMEKLLRGAVPNRDLLFRTAAEELSLHAGSRPATIGFQVYKQCS